MVGSAPDSLIENPPATSYEAFSGGQLQITEISSSDEDEINAGPFAKSAKGLGLEVRTTFTIDDLSRASNEAQPQFGKLRNGSSICLGQHER